MTIIQPTLEQTRRINRKRTYSGPGFGPRSFECFGLNLSLSIGLSPGSGGTPAIDFASKVGGSLILAFQSDKGLVYNGTLAPTSGNTSTTAVTLTNSGSTAPAALRVKATNSSTVGSGATFNIYTDGGTTPIMTGVTPTAATPITLTGLPSVALLWSAGAGVTNDTWDATAITWTDQASVPHNASQATLTSQPIITPGTGGKLGLKGNATTTTLQTLLTLPAPGTTPSYIFVLARMLSTPSANAAIVASGGGTAIGIYCASSTLNIVQFAGTALANPTAVTVNTWYGMTGKFVGSTSDSLKVGSAAAVTGTSSGTTTPPAGICLFSVASGFYAPCEIMLVLIANAPFYAGLAADVTGWCGVTQV